MKKAATMGSGPCADDKANAITKIQRLNHHPRDIQVGTAT
jgi:hypothetical protein